MPPAVETQNLNYWTTREVPSGSVLIRPCIRRLHVYTKLQCFGYLMQRADPLAQSLMLGKIEGRRRRGRQRTRWLEHHQLNRHEFEQAPGDGEGQGSLACCSLWGCKELDMTEKLNSRICRQLDHMT